MENSIGNAKRFALAGNALFTIKNVKTGNRFTYKVRRCEDNAGLSFVSLLNGPDNYSNYRYIGVINHGNFRTTAKSFAPNSKSTKAFKWFWENVNRLPKSVQTFHEGRCGRCGRRLTVPESISSGFGPRCLGVV